MGFIRRAKQDTFGGLLVAPGGKIEPTDFEEIEKTAYFCVEKAAVRELKEECELNYSEKRLNYFCSLRLPNDRVVLSFYGELLSSDRYSNLEFFSEEEIIKRNDFAPGMKTESLLLFKKLKEI